MAYIVNDRSKKILDILIKSNVDISKLSILRKTAADWTREEAEKILNPELEASQPGHDQPPDSPSGGVTQTDSYRLGTFFARPMMGGTPAYELYPDLGLKAAQRLIHLHKISPSRGYLYTILSKDIDEKVPEVKQDIVDLVADSGDFYNFFSHNFHQKYPESFRPMMKALLKKDPIQYFYNKHNSRDKLGITHQMINEVDLTEEERVAISEEMEKWNHPEQRSESRIEEIIKYRAWINNPDLLAPVMNDRIKWSIKNSHPRRRKELVEAYPEASKAVMIIWARESPEKFISSSSDIFFAEPLQIALDELSIYDPETFFHKIYSRGQRNPEVYFSGKINYKENLIDAVKALLYGSAADPQYSREAKPEFFLKMDYWKENVFDKIGAPTTLNDVEIESLAMEEYLKKIGSMRSAMLEYYGDGYAEAGGLVSAFVKEHVENLFGDSPYSINITDNYPDELSNPAVIKLADLYAETNNSRFFIDDVYKHFPEIAKKHVFTFLKDSPLLFFKKELHSIYPDHINTALSYYRNMMLELGSSNKRSRLIDEYFRLKLDDIDSKEAREEVVLMLINTDLSKAINLKIVNKYPNVYIDSEAGMEKEFPFEFFVTGAAKSLGSVMNDENKAKIEGLLKEAAIALAKSNPIDFFSMQTDGTKLHYYRVLFKYVHWDSFEVDEETFEEAQNKIYFKMINSEEFDSDSIIANKYPSLRETALESFMENGSIEKFYIAIKEFDINISTEDEKLMLEKLVYKGSDLRATKERSYENKPELHVARLFGYIKNNDNQIKEKFPEFLREAAVRFADHIANSELKASRKYFTEYGVDKLYPDIRFGRIESLRDIDDKDKAIQHYKRMRTQLAPEGLPSHIQINRSIYQQDQRPSGWESTRYTISQNNVEPTSVLYKINKSLIHAGDGVAHTNVGASGFTSAWALAAFHEGPEMAPDKDGVVDSDDILDEKRSLVIEQYQSDYPVVYDKVFLGNSVRDEGQEVIEQDYGVLDNLIIQNLNLEAAQNWIERNDLLKEWQEFLKSKTVEGEDHSEEWISSVMKTFFIDHVQPAGEIGNPTAALHLPIEIAPQVKDARAHFDIISKVYPYLVIINTIEVAKAKNLGHIYILKNAPFYASISNSSKANRLYKIIPELVATRRSIAGKLFIENSKEDNYSDTTSEEVYEIPATNESIALLRSEAERVSGKRSGYDFSLTPAQNRVKRTILRKERVWNPSPEKIEKLKELTNIIKIELRGVDVPEFYDPVSAIKYLSKDIRSKVVPKKRFNRIFGPIIGELGKLSRASRLKRLVDEMFVKTSSATSDRRKVLRKFLIFKVMSATN
jgi:hypothetical protein